jgi:hypothetical protein
MSGFPRIVPSVGLFQDASVTGNADGSKSQRVGGYQPVFDVVDLARWSSRRGAAMEVTVHAHADTGIVHDVLVRARQEGGIERRIV